MGLVRYRIDHEDRIAEVNEGWSSFAERNGGWGIDVSGILGRQLWSFLADLPTVSLYQSMVRRVRGGGPAVRFQFRCDAPACRRLLAMEIAGEPDGVVRFDVAGVKEVPRPAVELLEPARPRSGRYLTMCGWCNRIRVQEETWVEVENAISELGLFGVQVMPGITHGICPRCHDAMVSQLDESVAGASPATLGALPE